MFSHYINHLENTGALDPDGTQVPDHSLCPRPVPLGQRRGTLSIQLTHTKTPSPVLRQHLPSRAVYRRPSCLRKPPTKEQTQKIYNQEYEEVVAWIENTLDLSDESPYYPMVPTSLLNPDIVLPTKLYRAQDSFAKPPPSCMPESWEFNLDGA